MSHEREREREIERGEKGGSSPAPAPPALQRDSLAVQHTRTDLMYKSNPAKVRQAQAAAVEIVSELNTTNYVHQYSAVQYCTVLQSDHSDSKQLY